MKFIILVSILYIFLLNVHSENFFYDLQTCFTEVDKLNGEDINCDMTVIDKYNNKTIFPLLSELVLKPYFKFFKVNLNKPCPFWPDNRVCSSKNCHVKACEMDSVPAGLKNEENITCNNNSISDNKSQILNSVDLTISKSDQASLEGWQKYDFSTMNFCVIEDESSKDCQYVDLLINPEQYTAYSGNPSHKIWKAIYEENCFYELTPAHKVYGISHDHIKNLCLEKRAFYMAISGLHASITVHLCSKYYFPSNKFKRNPIEFIKRFAVSNVRSEGVKRLRNLYFVYLLELRALAKISYYLRQETFYTGNASDDEFVQFKMKQLLQAIKSFPCHFDEHVMFKGRNSSEIAQLKEEIRSHFWNISRIMDCVSCDKCRLWGKLQTQGLGTAFKILFDPVFTNPNTRKRMKLKRTEIVALINAFARLSNSIHELFTYYRSVDEIDIANTKGKLPINFFTTTQSPLDGFKKQFQNPQKPKHNNVPSKMEL